MSLSNKNRAILIIGHSHTEAIRSALRDRSDRDVTIVNLNQTDRTTPLQEKIGRGGYLPEAARGVLVVSMIGGNYYNTFGLIESSIKFEFTEPGEADFTPTPGRELITYELMHHAFATSMKRGVLRNIGLLRDHYPDARFVHVSSPPPIEDNEHIAGNPGGYFSDKVHLGVAPPGLRLKLYSLQESIVREHCRRQGIEMLPPPPKAVTVEGFLDRAFWKNDPTHANAAYGGLVLGQLEEIG